MSSAIHLTATQDGSTTAFSTIFEEHYHSIFGAIQESEHVFIEAGLLPLLRVSSGLRVLEIGLGTGLNALLTSLEAEKMHVPVFYCGLEKYPFPVELVGELNYPEQVPEREIASAVLKAIHESPWKEEHRLSPFFRFKKELLDFNDFSAQEVYDLVYYDAFAPNAQPELWTADLFLAMFNALKPGGVLVTYCAKGVVKRTLKAVGFLVESLPGPPRKREMTRAVKPIP